MKAKHLSFMGCLAATALIASPLLAEQQKKSVTTSHSRIHRTAPRTAQVMAGSQRNISPSYGNTRRYTGTQRYVGSNRQYSSSRYYTQNRYAGRGYNGGTRYYNGDPRYYYGGSSYPYYGYYSSWPSASYGYYPYASYGSYPYSYYGSYGNSYSYYQPRYTYYQRAYGYDDATVAAVQRRLGELGYDSGIVDGVVGPQTRAAIAAFQSTHGMVVDGVITTRLLDRMGLT
jgi:Putative peptidoglycan binding domain